MPAKVLFVDDDPEMCELMVDVLSARGETVSTANTLAKAVELLESLEFDLVITDLELGNSSGLEVCERVRTTQPEVPVIMLTGHATMSSAIGAIRAGAYDFVTKPVDVAVVGLAVDRAVGHRRIRAELKDLKDKLLATENPGQLVGQSTAMRKVYSLIQRVRDTPASVLIAGESGTGKELVARALHAETSRAQRPFVAINCAAVPAQLLESELFGHAKGAFTDARTDRQGLFQQANGGTLLLDEIGEMPVEMQAKLLRVLQERVVRPVGGTQEIPVDVRILAATNRDLESEVERGNFREDLFYRLNVVQINVPPLRSRGTDILLLASHFIQDSAQKLGRKIDGLSPEAAQLLLDYDWPGNVRQLQNCIERAVTLTRFEQIAPVDLPERVRKFSPAPSLVLEADPEYVLPLEVMERRYIEMVLKFTSSNKSQAARLLGLDRRTLYRKLERFEQQSNGTPEPLEDRA